jgi:hypothetical protein
VYRNTVVEIMRRVGIGMRSFTDGTSLPQVAAAD